MKADRVQWSGLACDHTSNRRWGLVASVVTKAVYPEAEAEALGFEAEAPVLETEAEAARQCINKSHIWAVTLKRKEYKHFLT